MKPLLLIIAFIFIGFFCAAQQKILFDATKAESAGNADWIIDADVHNLGFNNGPAIPGSGSESNPQRIPTPAQTGINSSTSETYWDGGLSFWAIDCAKQGYIVETLPYNGKISYGDTTNPQDLSNYNTYIVCEPNILFTASEKTAILNFVKNGGGLFMISDHAISDRNGDGYDSPQIWDDLLQNNISGNSNPFGIIFNQDNFSQTSSNLAALPSNDSILHGSFGNVSKVMWSNGASITINTTANASVEAVIYQNGSSTSQNSKVMVARARYGKGKVVAIGDSSPCDDGTGDTNDALYTGYNGDVTPNHRNLLMNSTIWLTTQSTHTYTFTGNGNWSDATNWQNNLIPPANLSPGDSVIINPITGGQCTLDILQHIGTGATLTIATGKAFVIEGALTIQ